MKKPRWVLTMGTLSKRTKILLMLFLLMLALALLLAGGSVYLARNWLENQVQPVIVQEQFAFRNWVCRNSQNSRVLRIYEKMDRIDCHSDVRLWLLADIVASPTKRPLYP